MKKPLISIIIPMYNCKSYIETCINSIIKQTYKNLEIIIVDDGSNDDSLKICKSLQKKDKRLTIYSKENGGVSSARNYGLERCNGKYLCFVDSDDTIEKTMIEKMYENIISYNSDISIIGLKEMNKDISLKENIKTMDSKTFLISLFELKDFPAGVINKMYKKSCIKNTKFENYKVGEDLLFNFSASNNKDIKIVYDNIKLYNYRKDSISSVIHSTFKKHNFDVFEVLDKIKNNSNDKHIIKKTKSRYPIEAMKIISKMITSDYSNKEEYDRCYKYIKKYIIYTITNIKISIVKKVSLIITIILKPFLKSKLSKKFFFYLKKNME